jgi:hypothetical protein
MRQILEENKDRKVVVDRYKLIDILTSNREKHEKEYLLAVKGYKGKLNKKLDDAIEKSRKKLEERYQAIKVKIANMTDEDMEDQEVFFNLIDSIVLELEPPKSYTKEYDAAIDMAKWDTRETLELTTKEFNCFVRDEWTWTKEFKKMSRSYVG